MDNIQNCDSYNFNYLIIKIYEYFYIQFSMYSSVAAILITHICANLDRPNLYLDYRDLSQHIQRIQGYYCQAVQDQFHFI
jgi:hypothetical protein